jgi:hypothetical protein
VSKFRKAQTGMTLAEHLQEIRHRFFVCATVIFLVGRGGRGSSIRRFCFSSRAVLQRVTRTARSW